jgi:hypothetical protein
VTSCILKEVNAALCFVFLVLCAACVRAQQNDWLVVPGERLGPIPSSITRAGLDQLLGKDRVHDQPVDSGEGPEPATVVFSETPGAALAIFWRDNRTVRDVMICYRLEDRPCKWHARGGVRGGHFSSDPGDRMWAGGSFPGGVEDWRPPSEKGEQGWGSDSKFP